MRYDPFNHNRRSTCLRGYNYSRAGAYFLTICVLDRECLLGNCVGEEIILSQIAETAKRCWINIPEHFENIILDEFVIMPNHIHGIISIRNGTHRRGVPWNAPTRTSISPPKGSLSVVVRNYKAAAARLIRLAGHHEFRWQRCFLPVRYSYEDLQIRLCFAIRNRPPILCGIHKRNRDALGITTTEGFHPQKEDYP